MGERYSMRMHMKQAEKVMAVMAEGLDYGFLRLGLWDRRTKPGLYDPLAADTAILSVAELDREGGD